jgi:hypothetical protein
MSGASIAVVRGMWEAFLRNEDRLPKGFSDAEEALVEVGLGNPRRA